MLLQCLVFGSLSSVTSRKFVGRQHDLLDRYEISISQITVIQQIRSYTGCD